MVVDVLVVVVVNVTVVEVVAVLVVVVVWTQGQNRLRSLSGLYGHRSEASLFQAQMEIPNHVYHRGHTRADELSNLIKATHSAPTSDTISSNSKESVGQKFSEHAMPWSAHASSQERPSSAKDHCAARRRAPGSELSVLPHATRQKSAKRKKQFFTGRRLKRNIH